jgi:hypothetical protein
MDEKPQKNCNFRKLKQVNSISNSLWNDVDQVDSTNRFSESKNQIKTCLSPDLESRFNRNKNSSDQKKRPYKISTDKKLRLATPDQKKAVLTNLECLTPFSKKFEEQITIFSGLKYGEDYAIAMMNENEGAVVSYSGKLYTFSVNAADNSLLDYCD